MATYPHQGRYKSARNSDRGDNEGRYKVSVSGPSFHIEYTFNPSIQCSMLVTDQQGRQTKIVVDIKEGDTLEVLPVSIHHTDDSYQHGNSGVGFDSASETPGTDRPDEEIGSLRSDEGLDRREVHCATCTCAVGVRPRSPSKVAPCMPEE